MPNTLVHLGIQGLGSRLISKKIDLKWVFLGCIIPDIPWILRRAILSLDTSIDIYDLRLYTLVQASFLFCLVLSAVFALLSEKPRLVFVILAVNSLLHLLLDSVEIKWGNGIHLLAPFDWQLLNFGLVWPDSTLVAILSMTGFLFCLWALFHSPPAALRIQLKNRLRLLTALLLFSVYTIAPLAFLTGPYSADVNSIATLKEKQNRIGKELYMDRQTYRRSDEGDTVLTFTGEPLRIIGDQQATDNSKVSLIGKFVDYDAIHVHHFHEYHSPWRDWASYTGLGLFALTWLIALVRQREKR